MLKRLALTADLLRNKAGSLALEFALVAPILFMVTLGAMDLARATWISTTLEHAAKEAARFASLRGAQSFNPVTADQVTDYVKARAVGVSESGLSVAVAWSPDNNSGSAVQVQLNYDYQSLLKS